jgi:hypothetical protein
MAHMVSFKAAAIHGRQLGPASPDAGLPRIDQRLVKEAIGGVFFSSRSAAF